VGFGSFCFHSTLKYPWQLVDELSMIYTTCLMCYASFARGRSTTYSLLLFFALLSLALFIGLAIAGPVPSAPSVHPVEGVVAPESASVEPTGELTPSPGGVQPAGGTGSTGVSKREDHNPLEERFSPILALYNGRRCGGGALYVSLNSLRFDTCYHHIYESAKVISGGGLNYGVYVGNQACRGTLLHFVNTCYNVNPIGQTVFKLR